jgi:hypothetical protein
VTAIVECATGHKFVDSKNLRVVGGADSLDYD